MYVCALYSIGECNTVQSSDLFEVEVRVAGGPYSVSLRVRPGTEESAHQIAVGDHLPG